MKINKPCSLFCLFDHSFTREFWSLFFNYWLRLLNNSVEVWVLLTVSISMHLIPILLLLVLKFKNSHYSFRNQQSLAYFFLHSISQKCGMACHAESSGACHGLITWLQSAQPWPIVFSSMLFTFGWSNQRNHLQCHGWSLAITCYATTSVCEPSES